MVLLNGINLILCLLTGISLNSMRPVNRLRLSPALLFQFLLPLQAIQLEDITLQQLDLI